MLVQLDGIVFDHTPGSAADDALSIRINCANPAPDWIRLRQDAHHRRVRAPLPRFARLLDARIQAQPQGA